MALDKLEAICMATLADLRSKGTLKGKEKIITGVKQAQGGKGPRYYLAGHGRKEFLKMNSNSYLGLTLDKKVLAAEEKASRKYGVGPGAVRFISGTCASHVELEKKLAAFHGREAAIIFSAAYAAIVGIIPQLVNKETIVLSDALNHNSIINSVRLSRPSDKAIFKHLDMADLEEKLKACIGKGRRVILVTDGVFSMRGDYAPLDRITEICDRYQSDFEEGIITVVDDSHGIGAFGTTGRGTEEFTKARADILIATLGKALGVNGGYAVASETIISYLRETAPLYIYSNPITPSEAAAATKSLEILDSPKGVKLLAHVRKLTKQFEQGLIKGGYETIPSENPIVPLMVRETKKTSALVKHLFAKGILATGLNFPVVPRGDEEIRFQISASHTAKDIDYVLKVLADYS